MPDIVSVLLMIFGPLIGFILTIWGGRVLLRFAYRFITGKK